MEPLHLPHRPQLDAGRPGRRGRARRRRGFGRNAYPGIEGSVYYYYGFPKNAMNDWLVAEHRKRFNVPPDFFTAGGMAAASAVITAIKKAGGTDSEKLIAAMEGMDFDTPKGKMTFR